MILGRVGQHEVQVDGRDVVGVRQRHLGHRRAFALQQLDGAQHAALDVFVEAIEQVAREHADPQAFHRGGVGHSRTRDAAGCITL